MRGALAGRPALREAVLDVAGGRHRGAADRLVLLGALAALPAALTGATDWADTEAGDDRVRRAGAAHAAVNGGALVLQLASLSARRRGRRRMGVGLSLAAQGLLGAGGMLGGHLAFARGVGVDQTVFDPGPSDWTPLVAGEPGAGPSSGRAGETPVVLVRDGAGIRALHDRCSHRGCSLAGGRIDAGAIECPCHGSRFSLDDGRVLRGPATAPQPVFDVRRVGEGLEARRRA
ncbi:MAG: Rieske (2Fe-2S) protein [Solirubrobacteraceae bacterium]|nr:Rieske (2Fe-2S) protein [Solirubrobacteraceae bacterium]